MMKQTLILFFTLTGFVLRVSSQSLVDYFPTCAVSAFLSSSVPYLRYGLGGVWGISSMA